MSPDRPLREIMSTRIVTVEPDDTLATVRQIFDGAGFHHLLVVDQGRLLGVISDRDLLRALSPYVSTLSETARDAATLNKRAHQIMSRQPITLAQDDGVAAASATLLAHDVSCVPVVDAEQRLVGIVTWRDLLKALAPARTQAPSPGPARG